MKSVTISLHKLTFSLNSCKDLRWQHCMNPLEQVKPTYPEKKTAILSSLTETLQQHQRLTVWKLIS